MQITASDSTFKSKEPEMSLGVLPMSHNLSLMAISHGGVYRGDGVVVMPRFNLEEILNAIDQYKLGRLWLVRCSILAQLLLILTLNTGASNRPGNAEFPRAGQEIQHQ